MEMHQVRYFLATVSELNFTKAAEKSNVTQPSLTRAIKQLEDELGGDLFRRERPRAQLTELGQRMYPLLKQCYEIAIAADLGDGWERLDRWPLFTEEFGLILSAKHRLASRSAIEIDELRQE